MGCGNPSLGSRWRSQKVLQRGIVEHRIRQHPLKTIVLVLQLPQPPRLVWRGLGSMAADASPSIPLNFALNL